MFPEMFDQYYPTFLPQPQSKLLYITGDSEEYQMIKIVQENSIFQHNSNSSFHILEDMVFFNEQSQHSESVQQNASEEKSTTERRKRKEKSEKRENKKNSNVIKKMGRLILNNISSYKLENGRQNQGIIQMQGMLKHRHNFNSKSKCMTDGFNTYHLQALFNVKDKKVSAFNLRTTRRIFTKLQRRQVQKSIQIKGEAKLLYLNTFKCSSLRLANRKLARRLQTSQAQK